MYKYFATIVKGEIVELCSSIGDLEAKENQIPLTKNEFDFLSVTKCDLFLTCYLITSIQTKINEFNKGAK